MSRHVDIDQLLAYAHGQLSEDDAGAVIEHSESCNQCGNELAVLLALRHEQERAAVPSSAIGTGASPLPRLARLAASLAIAVLVGATALWWSGLLDGGAGTGAGGWADLATDEPPDQTLVDWLFEPAPVPAIRAPVTPGTDPVAAERELLAAKRAALELVVQRRYGEAITALDTLSAAHPDDTEIAAYLGIASYLAGDLSDDTRALLLRAAASPRQPVGRTAGWYLANYYLRAERPEEALLILESLAQTRDLAGENAAALLVRFPPDMRR